MSATGAGERERHFQLQTEDILSEAGLGARRGVCCVATCGDGQLAVAIARGGLHCLGGPALQAKSQSALCCRQCEMSARLV